MEEQDRYAQGLEVRRSVLGDQYVNRALEKKDPFTADFQEMITRYAWGEIWTRPGLPRRPLMLERLNKARARSGKAALLEQIEVSAPLLPEYKSGGSSGSETSRRSRRLHHVRGHLVRRGSKLFWRVPHLRGSARIGSIRTRTVTWQFDPSFSSSRISGNPGPSAAAPV